MTKIVSEIIGRSTGGGSPGRWTTGLWTKDYHFRGDVVQTVEQGCQKAMVAGSSPAVSAIPAFHSYIVASS